MTSAPVSRKKKVVVIDDDPIVLQVARGHLVGAGYQVVLRESALGTVQFVRSEQPDLVLIDLQMPALSGGRLASLLASDAKTRHVGVILYSSTCSAELVAIAEQTGALGAISKSESSHDFVLRFNALANKHAAKLPEQD